MEEFVGDREKGTEGYRESDRCRTWGGRGEEEDLREAAGRGGVECGAAATAEE
jgi:hypothetical protein